MLGLVYSNDILFDALIQGLVYALVAFGLLLVYRATGVINFAHGQIGAFGGYLMALLLIRYDIPYLVSAPLGLASGVVLGMASELVLRRLFTQPRLLLFVATLGLTQVIQLLQLRLPIPDEQASSVGFPVLIDGSWEIAGLTVTGPQLTVLLVVPLLMVFFGWLFQRSRFGMQVRATADNLPAAQLAAISVRAVSTKVWALAGLLATLSALLIAPLQGGSLGIVQTALGPKLLLLSLTAAMIGRMRSFGWTLVGGLAVGVIDRFLFTWAGNGSAPVGSNTAIMFVLLLALLFTIGRRQTAGGDWSLTPRMRAARQELVGHPLYRVLTFVGFAVLALAALAVPRLVDKPTDLLAYAQIPLYVIVALSATVITGWAGQLSLGQFGFVAIGSYLTCYYANELNYYVSVGLGVVWGIAVSLLIGIPALRLRGLYLAIVTLGFGLAIRAWFVIGSKVSPKADGRTQLVNFNKDRTKGFDLLFWEVKGKDFRGIYWFCLTVMLLAIVLVWRVRRTGIGRSIIAVRDNEPTAAAYTVSPTRAKLLAFCLSGGLAALAGGLLPLTASNAQFKIDQVQFDPQESFRIVAIAVVGGIASITGAILGTLLIVGLPVIFTGTKQVELFASGLGMMVVLLYLPGGLISVLHSVRDNLLGWLTRRTGWKPPARAEGAAVTSLARSGAPTAAAPLQVADLSVTLGGRRIIDNVSIGVRPGEIVGLIGTNGAGKTTLMNAVSGFVPATGRVELFGRDVGDLPAYRRARLGEGRAFQNARLFGSLTARETLMVALEARQRSLLIPSILALPPSPMAERRKRREADEIISYLGLGRYADSLLAELSTGTRRIVELGALLALDSKLLLLDEPTAGVAQKETEAFAPLIKTISQELGAAILIIEHDMPMVMSISDRIYCLEAGRVIAQGTPAEVRANPDVIASYLGTDERAIQRSGTAAPNDPGASRS